MTSVTIYHNPRCSKSRQTLALLQARGVGINVVHYLETPPSSGELKKIVQMLGVPAMALVRTGEAAFQAAGLSPDASDDEAIAAIIAAPKLLQRPIVTCGGRARIGRPPERVLEILTARHGRDQ